MKYNINPARPAITVHISRDDHDDNQADYPLLSRDTNK